MLKDDFADVIRLQTEAKAQGVCWICLEIHSKDEKFPATKTRALSNKTDKKGLQVKICPRCDSGQPLEAS
jgi:hypothetical protein